MDKRKLSVCDFLPLFVCKLLPTGGNYLHTIRPNHPQKLKIREILNSPEASLRGDGLTH